MSRRTVKRHREEGCHSAGWLTTFNDLVTLLMVFFVLLFTMSTIDTKKMKDFQYALQSGLGILSEGTRVSVGIQTSRPIHDMGQSFYQAQSEVDPPDDEIKPRRIENVLHDLDAEDGIHVRYSNQGAHITFEDFLLFNFGKADVNPAGFPFLNRIAALIHKIPYPVRVEGHTDNVPIHTERFPSNWDLSIARAVNVVRYLTDVGKVNPQRLSAAGYGDSKPVVPNDSRVHRARNRRVEIVLAMEGET